MFNNDKEFSFFSLFLKEWLCSDLFPAVFELHLLPYVSSCGHQRAVTRHCQCSPESSLRQSLKETHWDHNEQQPFGANITQWFGGIGWKLLFSLRQTGLGTLRQRLTLTGPPSTAGLSAVLSVLVCRLDNVTGTGFTLGKVLLTFMFPHHWQSTKPEPANSAQKPQLGVKRVDTKQRVWLGIFKTKSLHLESFIFSNKKKFNDDAEISVKDERPVRVFFFLFSSFKNFFRNWV